MRALAALIQRLTNMLLFRRVLVGAVEIKGRPMIVVELRSMLTTKVFVASIATFRGLAPLIVDHDWYAKGDFHTQGSELTNTTDIDIPAWAFPSVSIQASAGLYVINQMEAEATEKPTLH